MQEDDLVFGYDATGEGDRTALPARVAHVAVEVHVLGPVVVRHPPTAAKLGRRSKRKRLDNMSNICHMDRMKTDDALNPHLHLTEVDHVL